MFAGESVQVTKEIEERLEEEALEREREVVVETKTTTMMSTRCLKSRMATTKTNSPIYTHNEHVD